MSNIELDNTAYKSDPSLETMRTTSIDEVASFLLSFAIMIGLAVALLGALFIMANWKSAPKAIVLEAERIAGRGDNPPGFERDIEPPAAEEVEQLTEPSVEQTLQSVTDAISSIAANLESAEAAAAADGSGRGDSRPPGPEGEGDDVIPRFERWDLKFTARDSKSYGLQLDFFKIELGAIGGGQTQVDYASNLSSTVQKKSGKPDDEKRIYFVNRSEGPLAKYERDFLTKASITTANGRIVLKLISKELEEQLAILEKTYAISKRGDKVSVKEFAKTVFECQASSAKGFQWTVIEQRYRVPK